MLRLTQELKSMKFLQRKWYGNQVKKGGSCTDIRVSFGYKTKCNILELQVFFLFTEIQGVRVCLFWLLLLFCIYCFPGFVKNILVRPIGFNFM
jgi:hypothetical protein